MKNIFSESRDLFIKTLEGISSSADRMANNAKFKTRELTLSSQKKDLLKQLSEISYELWLKGEQFPLEIEKLLHKVSTIDDELSLLKAEYVAYMNPKVEKELQKEQENNTITEDAENTELSNKTETSEETPEE
ncbi:MAG: hypothetical protein SPL05_01005 [Eubacteriales bacterium]|nr:hypothetical protein [Eubacteriales bacterium]